MPENLHILDYMLKKAGYYVWCRVIKIMREETMDSMKSSSTVSLIIRKILPILAICCCTAPVFAADPDYSGSFVSRSTLTGDWGGKRNYLAKKGVTINMDLTQVEQGVVDGGKDKSGMYGGRGNLTLNVDTGKLGLWPGGFLTAELEGNFGHGANLRNGGLMPVNSNQSFPMMGKDELNLPALTFTQFLSEYAGVIVGKMDTSGGDMNEFAQGKGDSQFMNMALNLNPALLITVPYSTLGAGVIILPVKDPNAALVSLSVVSAVGAANTSGFDNLNGNKLSYNVEGRILTDFFGMTGHQLAGAIYSNREFTSMDQRVVPDQKAPFAKKTGSWSVYYNFDQYLYEPVKGSGKGVGIFGRFAATDGNPNFIHYFYSLGIGGKGVIASRPYDRFGLGWYYIDIKSPTITGPSATLELFRDEQGVEAYYSVALTPWALLTPNIQYIHGGAQLLLLPAERKDIGNATIMALRMQVLF